jgi:phosphate-selective porin OprO and OprP
MKLIKKIITTLFMFVLLTGTISPWAQADDEPLSATDKKELPKSKPVEEGLTEEEKAEEQAENLREAIIENIDITDEDNELTKPTEQPEPQESTPTPELKPTPESTPTPESISTPESTPTPESISTPESTPTPEPTTKTEEEDKRWFDRLRVIPIAMSTFPEYVPGLAGHDWIFFGRTEGEYAHVSSGRLSDDSEFNVRSLRAGLIKVFYKKATVKLEVDFTDGENNWTDLYVRFNTKLGLITVGNQKIAQTLVNQTSRLARTFMEEALPADAFGLGRRVGIGWDLHKKNFGAHLTTFGGDINEGNGETGYGGRFYFNPSRTRFNLFHLGVSVVHEKIDGDARFRAYPETRVSGTRLVDTQDNKQVDKRSIYGLELAAAKDSYSLRGESFTAKWDRSSLRDTTFDGYYVQANWAMTGEAFQYRQGKFLRIRPRGNRGAWELAVRYSNVDLNDLDVHGGEQKNTTVGLNWYSPGNHFKLMGNIIFVDVDRDTINEDVTVAQVRAQFNW